MFNLRIVQANFGDCFIVEFGSAASPRYILIDGGPEQVFNDHLQAELAGISHAGGKIDLMAISHVDGDHVAGLLDLLATLQDQRANGLSELIEIDALWHNSFSATLDPDNEIQPQMNSLFGMAGTAAPLSAAAVLGIGEGNRARQFATLLGIPVNPGFASDLICVDDAPAAREFGNLTLQIVGPTRANLDTLRLEWLEWLDRFGPAIASGNPMLMANADQSIPNLSSVMFLASAHSRTVLFTGDGRSDHLLDGLVASGLLAAGGRLHVDILKVMHHGSDRNATKGFFKTVTADTYVVSANGHPDNPDLATLIWIVEAARDQGREIKLIFTNETTATQKLPAEYPPMEFGYEIIVMPPSDNTMVIELAS